MSDKSTTTKAALANTSVSLAARGFEVTELDKGLSKAVNLKDDEKRGDAINKAIAAGQGEVPFTKQSDPASLPGHKWVDRPNGQGGTERVQVFDPSSEFAKARQDDDPNPVPAAATQMTAENAEDTAPKLTDVKDDAEPAVPETAGKQGTVSAGSEDAANAAGDSKN